MRVNVARTLTLLAALLIPLGVAAAAKMPFEIAAGEAPDALREFGRQARVQLLFEYRLVRDLKTRAVMGDFEREDALAMLLNGTGLIFEFVNERTVAIHSGERTFADTKGDGSGDVAVRINSWLDRFRLAQADQSKRDETPASSTKSAQSSSETSEKRALEEIIVTAQKREERLVDVPQSVTVFGANDLVKLGATQFRDFANAVPGLSFTTQGAGYSQITLRGITTGGLDISPTVGIYVDEVPYGSSTAYANGARLSLDSALFDLERVEVLRGPQGTLYGASTMGGLIKYVSKSPNTERFSGDVQAGASSTQSGGTSFNVAGAFNAPLVTDKLAVRASGFESRDGGYIDNSTLGQEDVNSSDVYGGRLDFLFTPTDNLSIRVNGFLQEIARDGMSTVDYTRAGVPLDGNLSQRRAYAEPFDQRFRLVSGTINYDFGPASLTSISSYQTSKLDYITDVTAVFVPILATRGRPYVAVGQIDDLNTDRFTQEVRLAGERNKHVEWIVGGFYTHESSNRIQIIEGVGTAGQAPARDIFNIAIPSDYREYAAFGDLTFRLSERFDVTGGARYSSNEIVFEQTGSGILAVSRPKNTSDEDVVTYLANARYHFGDQSMAYFRFATGYRPGGPNVITAATTTFLTFAADHLDSYEIGYKAETSGRAFALDAAAYYLDWTDIQVAAFRNGLGTRVNAPDGATIRGAEIAFTARPTSSWVLSSALAYQDARMSAANADIQAADGERLPNVPRLTATVNADYVFENAEWHPTIGVTGRHVSDRTSSFAARADQYHLPEYSLFDLRAGFAVGRTSVQLYVRNVLDERGQLLSLPTTLAAQPSILQPRTFGLTVTAHF